MESLVYEDSPLAEFLEGTAPVEADREPSAQTSSHASASDTVSFAPRGPPRELLGFRQRLVSLRKDRAALHIDRISHIHRRCKQYLLSKLAPDNSKFLERFRYVLVTSQLLNDHATTQGYNPRLSLQNVVTGMETVEWGKASLTPQGTVFTAGGAFLTAWSIHWVRTLARGRSIWYRGLILVMMFTVLTSVTYASYRWQRRNLTQRHAIEEASSLVSKAQELDASTAGAISLIQEVELVSRGYRISSPLPPVSRLDDQGQMKRCERLRHALRQALDNIIPPYAQAYNRFRDSAVEIDLERYNDIYEISRMDVEEVEALAHGGAEDFCDPETLKSLKTSLQRLHTSRKLFLCCLLTIPFTNRTNSITLWRDITDSMNNLATISSAASTNIDSILTEQSNYSQPQTPARLPLTPGWERLQAQTRKFSYLAQGTRELQAKLYLLREDCDRALATSPEESDSGEVTAKLLEQYDAFGVDLKSLVQEWEDGRTALVATLDRQIDRRTSLASSVGLINSRSTTPSSLSGLTAVGGSPADALKILNGEILSPIEPHSSDDEVFEAIAMPRPRTLLSREERIKKMQEERSRQAERREKADESRRMVKELESVIKLRPLPKNKKSRVTSL